MFDLEMLSSRFESEELDEVFDLLSAKNRTATHSSLRYKKKVKFHAAFQSLGKDSLSVAVSGPATPDLRFRFSRDKKGYLFEMSVGRLNEETVKTMRQALQKLATRLKAPKPTGFNTSKFDGIYLWGTDPDEDELEIYQEAVDNKQMSSMFRHHCIQLNLSVKKFVPKG